MNAEEHECAPGPDDSVSIEKKDVSDAETEKTAEQKQGECSCVNRRKTRHKRNRYEQGHKGHARLESIHPKRGMFATEVGKDEARRTKK